MNDNGALHGRTHHHRRVSGHPGAAMRLAVEQYPDQTKPHKIMVAIKLLYTAFGIELMLSFLDDFLTGELFSFGGLFGLFLIFWIYWALIRLIDRGHKKALIVFSTCVILNWAFVISVLIFDLPMESFTLAEGAISPRSNNLLFNTLSTSASVMNAIALYLLFQKSSFGWFGQRAQMKRVG
ncbi:MAG: hypothetical protein NUV50_07025 [Rhodospirillales bacterium]|nr:hypothetical protein [Rhodospirillales bacterium]